jgi:hypothetical protein
MLKPSFCHQTAPIFLFSFSVKFKRNKRWVLHQFGQSAGRLKCQNWQSAEIREEETGKAPKSEKRKLAKRRNQRRGNWQSAEIRGEGGALPL